MDAECPRPERDFDSEYESESSKPSSVVILPEQEEVILPPRCPEPGIFSPPEAGKEGSQEDLSFLAPGNDSPKARFYGLLSGNTLTPQEKEQLRNAFEQSGLYQEALDDFDGRPQTPDVVLP